MMTVMMIMMMHTRKQRCWNGLCTRVSQRLAHQDHRQILQQPILDVLLQLRDLGSKLSHGSSQGWTV